jgi:hypothetical protein
MPNSRASLSDRLTTGLHQPDCLLLKLRCVGLLHFLHDPFPPLERVYPKLSSFHKFGAGSLSIHLGPKVRQAIEARGCRLLFLPAYSPDFSPIEEAFSKVKTFLRRQGARTREALQEALAQALDLITEADALGWFTHCGYPPPVLDERAQELCTPL